MWEPWFREWDRQLRMSCGHMKQYEIPAPLVVESFEKRSAIIGFLDYGPVYIRERLRDTLEPELSLFCRVDEIVSLDEKFNGKCYSIGRPFSSIWLRSDSSAFRWICPGCGRFFYDPTSLECYLSSDDIREGWPIISTPHGHLLIRGDIAKRLENFGQREFRIVPLNLRKEPIDKLPRRMMDIDFENLHEKHMVPLVGKVWRQDLLAETETEISSLVPDSFRWRMELEWINVVKRLPDEMGKLELAERRLRFERSPRWRTPL